MPRGPNGPLGDGEAEPCQWPIVHLIGRDRGVHHRGITAVVPAISVAIPSVAITSLICVAVSATVGAAIAATICITVTATIRVPVAATICC